MKALLLLIVGIAIGWVSTRQTPIMQSKLANVVLTTTKMDEEIRFYEGTLGFKVFYHDKTSCFLKTGGTNLVFVKTSKPKDATKGVCLDVGVPDLDAALKALNDAALKGDTSEPHILKLHDPDGSLVEIVKG